MRATRLALVLLAAAVTGCESPLRRPSSSNFVPPLDSPRRARQAEAPSATC